MKKVKCIFSDLDGTLLDNNTKFPHPFFYKYVENFNKHAIPFVLITGRLLEETLTIYDEIVKKTKKPESFPYLVCCNGAQIYDTINKKMIQNETFSDKSKKLIFDYAKEYGGKYKYSQFLFYTSTGQVKMWPSNQIIRSNLESDPTLRKNWEDELSVSNKKSNPDSEILEHVILHNAVKIEVLENLELEDLNNLNKIVVLVFDDSKEVMENEMHKFFDVQKDINLSYSSRRSIEISVAPFTKGVSAEFVSKLLKQDLDHCLVCGDSGNDLSMFLINAQSACPSWADKKIRDHVNKVYPGVAGEWVLKVFDKLYY